MERFGAVDILVNNAATNPFYGRLVDIDLARAEKTVQVNQQAFLDLDPMGLARLHGVRRWDA